MLIDLGRQTATGARRRMRGLEGVLGHLGLDVRVIELLPRFRSRYVGRVVRAPRALGSVDVVPETLAWSPSAVRRELDRIQPGMVVCVTDRCFHPALLGPWRTYVDFVDRLSISYRDRSQIAGSSLKRLGYRLLRRPHERFESSFRSRVDGAFAAGRADSEALGVDWLPIDSEADPRPLDQLRPPGGADTDLVFVGTLDYPPNEIAVSELHAIWPELSSSRPGISVLVAGARPTTRVREICARNGWELVADFGSVADVYQRSRIAVAPLEHASGLQIKVLDAAAFAVPQVVSAVVASGLDPQFPIVKCSGRFEWMAAIGRLLDDPVGARDLGERSRQHLRQHYGIEAVAAQARVALDLGTGDR